MFGKLKKLLVGNTGLRSFHSINMQPQKKQVQLDLEIKLQNTLD